MGSGVSRNAVALLIKYSSYKRNNLRKKVSVFSMLLLQGFQFKETPEHRYSVAGFVIEPIVTSYSKAEERIQRKQGPYLKHEYTIPVSLDLLRWGVQNIFKNGAN